MASTAPSRSLTGPTGKPSMARLAHGTGPVGHGVMKTT